MSPGQTIKEEEPWDRINGISGREEDQRSENKVDGIMYIERLENQALERMQTQVVPQFLYRYPAQLHSTGIIVPPWSVFSMCVLGKAGEQQ
jgi:hypothetical protein